MVIRHVKGKRSERYACRRSTLPARAGSSLKTGTAISTTGGATAAAAGTAPMVGSGCSSCMRARCRGPVRADPADCKNRSRSPGASGGADAQDGGAVDPVVGQVGQRGRCVVERVRRGGHTHRDLGRQGQEL